MAYIKAHYTWAIPGFWLTRADGEKEFSPYGVELTEEGRRLVHSFPCDCDKTLRREHLMEA